MPLRLGSMSLRRAEPWAIAALLALAYVVFSPVSADLAAQVYRIDLFREEGFTVWNGQWFAGHHTPGYSVLFPPLGALLGAHLAGALAAVASAAIFAPLAEEHFGERSRLGVAWFALGVAAMLYTGRLAFMLGVAFALAALLAAQRSRIALAIALSVCTALASPVSGLFLALAGVAWWLADRRPLAAWMTAASMLPVAIFALAFQEGGTEPFVATAFWPALAFAVVAVWVLPEEEKELRIGAALYGAALLLAFLVDTPMGGNATRLGQLFGGPILACALVGRRQTALAVLALPLLWWQIFPAVRDTARTVDDPSVRATYYQPMLAELARRSAGREAGRLEIPFTKNHWETAIVARQTPIARGWERQLDIKYNPLFYDHKLTSKRYRRWLDRNGVTFVAVPDAPLDDAGRSEARLIEAGLPYLRHVWSNADWRLYEVLDPEPLVRGPARLTQLGPESFTLDARRASSVVVRVRYSPYWSLDKPALGCVTATRDGWTRVWFMRAGRVQVNASFSPGRLVSRGPNCTTSA
jgi:hypothetical protein